MSTSKSARAGLHFPAARIQTNMKKRRLAKRIGPTAAVYLAAVMEYLTAEVAEGSLNFAKADGRVRITPRHIALAIKDDAEMSAVCEGVTIAGGGVQPYIHPALIPAKKGKKADDA